MKSSLPNLPAFKSERGLVKAGHFNRIRLALSRIGGPVSEVLGRRGLEFHLDRDAWLCVDRRLNNMPMLAWTDFSLQGRRGLHEPVACRILYYNAYAGVLVRSALEELDERLAIRLAEREPARGPRARVVVAFPAARR